ncbi:MAG: Ig-like domain-containing protein [Fimbriimonadales bacterium]|nr:Ig-like domain-containing protein [Fimbriimonadales bacterium]
MKHTMMWRMVMNTAQRLTIARVQCTGWLLIALCSIAFMTPLPTFAQGRPDIVWMRGGHRGQVNQIAYSPDGQYLASASEDSTIKIWRLSDGQLVRTLTGHASGVFSLAFSPDGQYLASGSEDAAVKIWRVSDGQLIRTLTGHAAGLRSVVFSPDGQYLATGGLDNLIKLWQTADWQEARTITGHASGVFALVFSPNGQYLASGSGDASVKLWRISDGQEVNTLTGHSGAVRALAFAPNGEYLTTGSDDLTIKVWRSSDWQEVRTITGHAQAVFSLRFSPNGQILASGSADATIKLWRVADWQEIRTLTGHQANVYSVGFSPDGQSLASGSWDRTIKLWRVASGQELRTLTAHRDHVYYVDWSPDGRYLASGGEETTVKIWRASDGQLLRTLEGHTAELRPVVFSPDGQYLATGGLDNLIKLWRTADWQEARTLAGHSSWVVALAFSPDGQYLASGCWDSTIKLWRVSDGQEIGVLTGHWSPVHVLTFSPDGQYLASGSYDTTIKIWRVADWQLITTLRHTAALRAVDFSPDGQTLASSGFDGVVKLWRVSDWQEFRSFLAHNDWAPCAFTPDGQYLLTWSVNAEIRFWRVSDGELLLTYDQETGWGVRGVTTLNIPFSPNGEFYAYGRGDATVVLARNPFYAGVVPIARLSVVPASVPADSQTTATLTLTYRYSDGTPIAGRTIRFRSSRGNADVFSSEIAVTNAQGQASVTVLSGTPGVSIFTCRDETAGIDLPAVAQASFVAPVVYPVIDSITTSLPISGPFPNSVPLPNTVAVRIADWRGAPGRVEFNLNGQIRTVQATGNLVATTYDMGSDLLHSPSGRWNELRITAYNAQGQASEARVIRWFGLSLPPSLQPSYWHPGFGGNPRVRVGLDGVELIFYVRWPHQAVNAASPVPAPFPFMSNTTWGHTTGQFVAEGRDFLEPISYPSSSVQGTASVRALGGLSHSVYLANFGWNVGGTLYGQFQFLPEFRLQQLLLGFQAGVVIETPDLLPFIPGAGFLTPYLDLYGRFSASANGAIRFGDSSSVFGFQQGDLTLNFALALILGLDRAYARWVSAAIWGGGSPFVWLQYPGSQQNAAYFYGNPYIHQVGLGLYIGGYVQVRIWFLRFRWDFTLLNHRFVYPNYGFGGYLGMPNWLGEITGEWEEPDRSYLTRLYHQVVADSQIFPQDDNWDVREQELIQNVFPSAEPALVWRDNRAVIAYAYDDPNLPAHQSTELRALMQQSDGGWQDTPITQDTALDSQPTLAVDASGNLIAVWTRMENVSPEPDPNLRLPKGEIAYAIYNAQTSTWSAPTLLTQDDRLDMNPQIVKGANGQLYLLWLKSPDNVFPTDFTQTRLPHTDIYMARWNGTAFVEVERAISRADTLESALTVSSDGTPLLVWSRDADGNPETRDTKLYYSYWNGSGWTPPQLVWNNPLPLSSPALAMGANDTPVLYFVRSELAHPEFVDHKQEELLVTSFTGSGWRTPASVARADTLGELGVITQPKGRVSAMWTAASQGVADLWPAIYDPTVEYWSNKVRLTQDDLTHEQQVFAAWDPAGNPSAVYIKRRLATEEREVEDDAGNRYPVQVVVPARADLYLLSHRPKPDLTIKEGDLTLQPFNPGPGQQVTIRARVSNLRALGARNVQVRFYDGDPDAGGTPIGTVRATPDPIVGGSFGTAELNWTVPTDGRSHVLCARVDPDNAIAETNETNNTASYPIAVLDLEAVAPVVEQYLPDGRLMLRFGVRNPSLVSPSDGVSWELRLNRVDGAIIAQGTTTAPAAGQTSELNFPWNPNLNVGRYTLYLVIDPENRFAEESETNNTASSEVALLADLVVNPALTNATRNGLQVQLNTTVQNLGWADAQNVAVQILDAPPGLGSVLASSAIASLPRYGSASLNLSFTLPRRVSRLWVAVNPDGVIEEVRRDNNEVILNLSWQSGDADGDGCVNDADLLLVVFNFGSRRLAEDVNRDGIVDDADLLAVLFRFGQAGIYREDINRDGVVDDTDLLAVLFVFGQPSVDSLADLNDDGLVDDADLLEVLFNFGSGC